MKNIVRLFLLAIACFLTSHAGIAQDYIYATGNPSFGVNFPIENGFINISNGNLHMEFSIATHKQRGALKLNERLVYDSRIWMIGHYSNYYWWPSNVPNTPYAQGGWRFIKGNETGSMAWNLVSSSVTDGCPYPPYDGQHTITTNTPVWTDPSGTSHAFTATLVSDQNDCTGTYTQTVNAGYATDATGYQVKDDGSGNPIVVDNDGTEVYPQVIDRFGNYWSTDANGNLIDDTGRTPVIVTQNGNVTYYDVLAPNGPINNNGTRVRYTVTTAPVGVKTWFNQVQDSGGAVIEWSGTLYPVQSIQLPDGTSYSFTYDGKVFAGDSTPHYGDLASVTLPTGGVIHYGFEVFEDSYYNQNRWASGRKVGSDPSTTFNHSVVSWCGVNDLNCKESTTVHKPSGDETVYEQKINNGAWNTSVAAYTGAVGGTPILSTVNCYSFDCGGNSSTYITKSLSTTTLSNGQNTQTQYQYDAPWTGKLTALKQWDYYSGSPSATPTRETDYAYSGFDLHQVTVLDNGVQAAQTTYDYTSSATATSGLAQHGSANAGGPYLQKVTDAGTGLYTMYVFDDAGTLLSSTDANGATSYGHDSSDTFVTSTTAPTPSSGVVLSTGAGYDFNSGVVLNTIDENTQPTNFNHYDTAGRATEIDYPDGGKTQFNYIDSNNRSTWIFQTANTHTDEVDQVDVFGRLSRKAVGDGQAQNPWYQTDYCYDSNGRLLFQPVRYQGQGWSTTKQCSGNGTTYSYDALDRITNINTPDGNTTYQYNSRAVKVTDVNGVQKITQYDAFGQITAVCEVSSTNYQGDVPQDCGLDIAGTGYLTTYAYDLYNHKTTITQGVQQRIFQTDSLGRTIYTKEPERGESNYSYTYNSTGLQVVRTRPRANPNPSTPYTHTTTQYDKVGRVVSISYDDGLTPTKTYGYDTSAGWTTFGQSNLKGHLSYAYASNPNYWAQTAYNYDSMGRILGMGECLPTLCGISAHDKQLSFSYDLAGNLTSEGDGASGVIQYDRSPAGEVTSITNLSYQNSLNPASLVSNIQNGPFGPTMYDLGNGLSAQTWYDSMGRFYQQVICGTATRSNCYNTQIYGEYSQTKGSRNLISCDTVISECFTYGYDDMNRLTSASGNVHNYAYGYDKYGNRWQSNTTASNPGFDQTTNHVLTNSYDAAGNVLSDGLHSYTYDAEGNVLTVSGGGTYGYDALNNRVFAQTSNSTYGYLFDFAGRRISSWLQPNDFGNEGRIYWDGRQIAYRAWNGSTYFNHQDWIGTERMRTDHLGSISSTYVSLPFGEGYAPNENDPTGNALDNLHFAQLDHDTESGTEHAQFRQYSSTQGRWMSPDPYDGSYNASDPQSFNRYGYVGNRPLSAIDPSGLFPLGCGFSATTSDGVTSVALGSGVGAYAALGACIASGIEKLFNIFSHPSCHACEHPRPDSSPGGTIWDEHGGFHPHPYSSIAAMIGDIDGAYSPGCEFGACGGGIGDTFQGRTPVQNQSPFDIQFIRDAAGKLVTIRIFDWAGKAWKDIDFGHNHGAGDPHQHPWDWNKTPPRLPGGWIVPYRIPGPFPVIIDPCVVNPMAPYCYKPYSGPA